MASELQRLVANKTFPKPHHRKGADQCDQRGFTSGNDFVWTGGLSLSSLSNEGILSNPRSICLENVLSNLALSIHNVTGSHCSKVGSRASLSGRRTSFCSVEFGRRHVPEAYVA